MQIIGGALKSAAPQLESEGVASRTFIGLWQATMGILLISMEPEDTVALLDDRARGLRGFGPNADAEVETVRPEAAGRRREQILAAAMIFSTCLEAAYLEAETAGLSGLYPECVLDKSVEILDREWGPWHLKHALAAQAALVASGTGAVVDVREPVRSAVKAASKAVGADPRQLRPRAVVVRVEADVSQGRPRWAYAMCSTAADGSGHEELREARCPVPAANMGRATLAATLAAVEAVFLDGPGARVVLETTSAAMLSGIMNVQARAAADAAIWSRIDKLLERIEVDWRRVPPTADDDFSRRCARLLGREMAQAV